MKKIFKSLIYITVMALFVVSCNEDDTTFTPLNFPSDSFIALESAANIVTLESNSDPIEIVVDYANTTAAHTSEVSVNFTITSTNAVEGVNYTIEGDKTKLTFPAGVFSQKIVIIPIDNSIEDGDKNLTITLTSSSVHVGLPGPDANNTSIGVTLTDDDCAFTFEDLDGIEWIGTDNASGSQGPNATQIKTTFDGTNLFMEGIAYGWMTNTGYWNEVIVDSFPVIVDMDPITGEFTVAFQELATTTWNGNPQTPYQISATGQYFSCLKSAVVKYTLYQGGAVLTQFTETIEY